MPTGKVRFFDEVKGFGFIAGDDGTDVFLHASAMPPEFPAVRPGTKLEYSIVDGKKGPQALSVTVLEQPHSVVAARRKPADEMVVIIEDLIKMLDNTSEVLRKGRYPDDRSLDKVARVLRAVANDLDMRG